MTSFALGIALLLGGVMVMIITVLLTRLISRNKASMDMVLSTPVAGEILKSNDAILLVQRGGGRVLYANQIAQEWFSATEDAPNLERLARRVRPTDALLALCAAEGKMRFSIEGRLVEGSSYYVPYVSPNGSGIGQSGGAILVTLHRPQVTALGGSDAPVNEKALNIFSELSQTMASSLEIHQTLESILESCERLIPSDFPEVTVWDPVSRALTPYRFVGLMGVDRRLEKAAERYSPDHGYSGYIVTQRRPLLVPNVDDFREARPSVERKQYPFNSYLGIPLQVGGELVGTLELASLSKNAFTESDLEVLRMISGEAAVALNNAILFQAEQKRVHELSGLANLTQLVGDLRESQDMYERLVTGVSQLLSVKTLGFLLYKESQRVLEARLPFLGIPSQFLELYHVSIPPGSPAEEVWLAQEVIVAQDATEDPRLVALGLNHLAKAAGIQHTMLLPLTATRSQLGYLQVGDRTDGQPFDQDDLRMLKIIAGQVSAIIENALLVRESQVRAQRSEALRRVASLTGSTATLNEVLALSIRELTRLLRADLGVVYLLEETIGELKVFKDALYGIPAEKIGMLGKISMTDSRYRSTVTATQKPFLMNNIPADLQVLSIYEPIFADLEIRSAMGVPLVVRGQGVGEIMLGSHSEGYFDRSDLTLVTTTAGQLASAVEKASLYVQTDESLQRRVTQLLALMRVGRELNTTLDWEHLLKLVYDEVVRTTQADCGTIVLFEFNVEKGVAPKVAYSIGDPVPETISQLDLGVIETGEPRIVADYQAEVEISGGGFKPPHAGVLSSLVVPIAYQESIVGLIHLHSREAECFDETALEIAQSLAVQAAIALGNAQRFREQIQRTELLNRRVETMTALLETSRNLRLDQPLDQALEVIAYGIQEATPFNIVLISVYHPDNANLERVAGAGIPLSAMQELKEHSQPWHAIIDTIRPEFCISQSYLIPYDQSPFVYSPDLHTVDILAIESQENRSENAWHPQDLLIVPLLDGGAKPLGVISVDAPRNGLRPDRPTIESLELFASQAGLMIESYNRLAELTGQAGNLQAELSRVESAMHSARRSLPVLLHKDLEQTLAIQRLNLRSQRIRASLDIAEMVNRQVTRLEVLRSLGSEMLTRMDFEAVLVAEPSEGGLRLLHAFGLQINTINPQALLGQRNPMRLTLHSGEPLFVANLEESEEWKSAPLLNACNAKAFICLPILLESAEKPLGNIDAVLLAINSAPIAYLTNEDEHIFSLLTRQVAVALQTLRLLNETNRRLQEMNLLVEFGRQLGTLDPTNILRTLIESTIKVLPAAHAAMVALWQPIQARLEPQYASGYIDNSKIMSITYHSGASLPGQVFEKGQAIRVDDVNFARDYNLASEQLLLYRDATEGRLPVSCMIIPIQTFDARLGVLVLDNFRSAAAFTEDDLALVTSLVRQTALTLENVRLYQASEERTAQLQALTTIAGTITSSLQVNELIRTLLQQLQTVVPFDTGTLWLRQAQKLTVRAARGFADSEERVGLSVELEDSLLLKEMITTGQPLSVGDVREDVRFPALLEHQYLSWLAVPLLSKGEVSGVIVLEKAESNFYSPAHIQALVTFSGQAAVALENASLYEDSVRRAMELDQRSQRLALLNRLSTALSGSLDLENILNSTAQELLRAVSCSVVSVVTFETPDQPLLRAEAPQTFSHVPVQLPVTPVFERLHQTLGIFSTEDVAQEKDLKALAEYFDYRATRSLLIVPLVVQNSLTGLLLVHTAFPYRFTTDEVELVRTVANQSAVAIQNARLFLETERLFAETEQRSAELATLFDFGVSVTQMLDQSRLLDITFENVGRLIPCDSVMVVLVDDDDLLVQRMDFGERKPAFRAPRKGSSFSEHIIEANTPLLVPDTHDPGRPVVGASGGIDCRCWLGVPLTVRGVPTGVISVQSETPGAFGDAQLRLLSQVANQLSVALDNSQLFTTVQNYAADLEQSVSERTEQLAREHRRTQTLLSIITELSTSLDLDLVLTRTLSVINETITAKHSLILLLQPDGINLFLRASQGYTTDFPKGGQASTLKANEGLAGWVIANRQPALVNDLLQDPRWKMRDDRASQNRSALAVPLMVGEETLGALMFYHPTESHFSDDQLDLIQAVAKQIAVAINNAQLYNLIRDQAERLGDMLRTQHVETSRSQAILEATADGVLVTDARREITLFNLSAERILGLAREDVLGANLDSFMGLFGKAAQQWGETIQIWSEDPSTYKPGDVYAERIELENRKVVAVTLSPVRLRSDFLGTVSIFRDITHEVEVERLKSEFVATVSHELRTPMTSIKGYVEIMLMGATGPLSEQQAHFLQVVKQNTERLAILVNDLLDVSRIEAGKVTLLMQALDLSEVVDEVLSTYAQRMKDEDRPMYFTRDVPQDLPKVIGDHDRVLQILDNLVENAYQYTPVNGHILVRLRQVGQDVQIEVNDDGIGIPEEDQPRVFERFFRGEDPLVMATSGTGLGLQIVQTLVELHKGRIWFESSGVRGEGSTFYVTLPIHEE